MVSYGGKDLQKRKVLSLEWKSEGVMDNESGENLPHGNVSCVSGYQRHYISDTSCNEISMSKTIDWSSLLQ